MPAVLLRQRINGDPTGNVSTGVRRWSSGTLRGGHPALRHVLEIRLDVPPKPGFPDRRLPVSDQGLRMLALKPPESFVCRPGRLPVVPRPQPRLTVELVDEDARTVQLLRGASRGTDVAGVGTGTGGANEDFGRLTAESVRRDDPVRLVRTLRGRSIRRHGHLEEALDLALHAAQTGHLDRLLR